jgi:hypothetical protein
MLPYSTLFTVDSLPLYENNDRKKISKSFVNADPGAFLQLVAIFRQPEVKVRKLFLPLLLTLGQTKPECLSLAIFLA